MNVGGCIKNSKAGEESAPPPPPFFRGGLLQKIEKARREHGGILMNTREGCDEYALFGTRLTRGDTTPWVFFFLPFFLFYQVL